MSLPLSGHHVALLLGGLSSEREVSLSSGKECGAALERLGAKVTYVDAGRDLAQVLTALKPDVVFNALHGEWGEDGCVQGILETLKVPFRLGRREQRLMVSIGISQFPQDGGDAASLQLCAESALGRARQDGGGCVRMATPTLGAAFLERREMETCLDSALLRREFEVLFQPQVTAEGATLIGNGPDVLTRVSMIGNDLRLDPGVGTCGKEGQSVPVGVGQPTLRIDGLTVGGTA